MSPPAAGPRASPGLCLHPTARLAPFPWQPPAPSSTAPLTFLPLLRNPWNKTKPTIGQCLWGQRAVTAFRLIYCLPSPMQQPTQKPPRAAFCFFPFLCRAAAGSAPRLLSVLSRHHCRPARGRASGCAAPGMGRTGTQQRGKGNRVLTGLLKSRACDFS